MLTNNPKQITIQNTGQFFNTYTIGPSGIKPGMLIQFNYKSPKGTHDGKPIVFVLENKGDRVIGLNLHYQMPILAQLIQIKNEQLWKFIENSQEYKNYLKTQGGNITSTEELQENPNLPNPVDVKIKKITFDTKKVRYPQTLLEDFTTEEVAASKKIFRVYLFKRMSGLTKLSIRV